MLTIGDFSRLSRITPRMLRHYDALGLLRPEEVGDNGYRYYRQEQLSDLMRIQWLKGYGFSLGEIIGDTLFTHIEKADRDYEGCYQMLVAQFAQQFAGESVAFINREDDTGDLGLRTSKLSYHPVALLEKYTVTVEEPCRFC